MTTDVFSFPFHRTVMAMAAIAACAACASAQAQTLTDQAKAGQAASAATKEAPKEAPKVAPEEAPKVAPKVAAKDGTKEDAKEAAKEDAEEDAEAAPALATTVETTVSAGLGVLDGSRAERAQFGQYNGLRNENTVLGLLGIDYSLRSPAKSTWVEFKGQNLLRDTRELGLVWKNPGSWKLTADYSELVHYDPNTVNSGMRGFGSSTPQVVHLPAGPGSGADLT